MLNTEIMNINFESLNKSHFPLLLKWLLNPHVKQWWDQEIKWTEELISERYTSYTRGYKILSFKEGIEIRAKIHAFIIKFNDIPIGYIQYYNTHDFPAHQGYDLSTLHESCAGLDCYIGELNYTNKGIGPKALAIFLKDFVLKEFEQVFVDPETDNLNAIKAYTKVGFNKIIGQQDFGIFWMLFERSLN